MYVCTCVCVCVCIRACLHVCVCTYVYMYVCMSLSLSLSVCVCVCPYKAYPHGKFYMQIYFRDQRTSANALLKISQLKTLESASGKAGGIGIILL